VQAALKRRKDKPGPVGQAVASLFGGLLKDARTRSRMSVAWQTRGTKEKGRSHRRVLVPASSMDGIVPGISFPCDIFEPAILSLLKELNPKDVLLEEEAGESTSLAASLVRVEQSILSIIAEMEEHGESSLLFKRLRQKESEQQALAHKLAEARLREQNPKSSAFAEMVTLVDIASSEQHRLRLRELLRTIIEEIWVLIVPRKSHRLCVVQIYFTGGGVRDYLIYYKAAGRGREGSWSAKSLAGDLSARKLDLRNQKHTDSLLQTLLEIDLSLLNRAMN
jgi:hypothetical protein